MNDFQADLEPHEYTVGMPDSSKCACGQGKSALIHEPIYETKIEVVVYTRGPLDHKPSGYDEYGADMLKWVAQEIFDGDKIGDYTVGESTAVPFEALREKLIAIGNDGDFFDDI